MRMLQRLVIVIAIYITANIYVTFSFYQATQSISVFVIFGPIFLISLIFPVLQSQEENWSTNQAVLRHVIRILSLLTVGLFSLIFFFTSLRDMALLASRLFVSEVTYKTASAWSIKIEAGVILGVFLIGLAQALKGPQVKYVKVPIKSLPKAFEGFRIVQISDLHIGPTIRSSYVQKVVKTVNAQSPALIALTGDITDGSPTELSSIARELSQMQSTYGRYFVTGNHEYYWDAPAWIKFHEEAGTRVLMNESEIIDIEGAHLAILGVPDVTGHQFVSSHVSNPNLAAKGVPTETIKILLAHQPVSYKTAHAAGVHLQLSGHTHSGQFFPWNLMIRFFHDYYRGLNRFNEMWIYVNPGTGYWGPPLRAAVSSEITVLDLHQA